MPQCLKTQFILKQQQTGGLTQWGEVTEISSLTFTRDYSKSEEENSGYQVSLPVYYELSLFA